MGGGGGSRGDRLGGQAGCGQNILEGPDNKVETGPSTANRRTQRKKTPPVFGHRRGVSACFGSLGRFWSGEGAARPGRGWICYGLRTVGKKENRCGSTV